MMGMDDSMAQASAGSALLVQPSWKTWAGHACGVLIGLLFIASGVWKITDPLGWAQRVVQLQMPAALGLPATLGAGTAELFAGVLLIVPRFRRWGAWLAGLLLLVFMVYIGVHYNTLMGEECSCFPWIKRSVGPGFFIGDAVMLLMAALAGMWAGPSHGRRGAVLVLAAIAVFTGASYGVAVARQQGLRAPAAVTVDGKPYSLTEGKIVLYFYDPQCMHCFRVAQQFSQMKWRGARIVAVAIRMPQYAAQFLSDTGLNAALTLDADLLRRVFRFGDPPYAVLLDGGIMQGAIAAFDDPEPRASLVKHGFIE